jgi:general secretion pathway protein L
MISLTTTSSRFFAWWLEELVACIPDRVRALLRRSPSFLLLTPTDNAAHFTLHRRGRVRQLGDLPLSPETDSKRAVSDLLDGIGPRHLDVVVNIPASNVLRRRVVLPIEAAENLREVLAFEMDRHTPFKAYDVAYDFRVVDTDVAARKLTVDLVVVPQSMIERAVVIARSFGLTASRIGIVEDGPDHGRSFTFRPYDVADGTTARRSLVVALAVTTAVLAVIAWYLPLYFDHQVSASYEARLGETRAEALHAEELKKRLIAAVNLSRLLTDRREAVPTVTSVLAEVTDRLPDDTWVNQLQLQDGKLTLSGLSPSAAALIAKLEASPLLSDVRFGSPVTPDPDVGGERFNIVARVALDRGS